MVEVADRQIAVQISFSKETWEALTADYRGLYRDMLNDSSVGDMPLTDRIDLFLEVETSGWRNRLEGHVWPDDLDDGVPF